MVSGARIRWKAQGEAKGHGTVLSIDVERVVVESTIPSPPGSRIEGELEEIPGSSLLMKVHSSRVQGDGSYRIEGRPIDLPRTLREQIASLLDSRCR